MSQEEELRTRLLSDLSQLNMPVYEVDLQLRPFSKTLYGRYFPVYDEQVMPKIYIYPYEDKNNTSFMDYYTILQTAVHELCHHIQYTSGSFVRSKGVMHDTQFWRLYNHYMNRARKFQMIGGEVCEKIM